MPATERPTAVLHPADLARLLDRAPAPRLLDVRSPAEFGTAHIPGSYNVPLDVLREHREELLAHLEEDVVLVCQSGMRAAQAEQALQGTGLGHLHVLDGGIRAWQAAGLALTRGEPKWDLERQVRLVAGSLVTASILASAFAPGLRWLAGGVGAGLTFAALTNTCAMGSVLARLPYNRGASCDIATVVRELSAGGQGAGRAA
ncbi:MAG TPA: rhodanese-like domain-containing protein [Acidimicrobiales bacterium]|nr:rhodanese-like domain-containing protein [Acidimicrobiales bacterium]